MQLYCRAIRKGCTSAQEIAIRASDLAYPITLADGTLASNIYLISCRGTIVRNARGTPILQSISKTESPSPSCADQHAAVNETDRCEHRYGMLRAADAEQYRQRQRNPTVMLNGSDALRAVAVKPHASGLCQGPSLHPISTRHVAASAKRHVPGTGQSQALLLLEFQKGLFAETKAHAVRERMRPSVSLSFQCLVLAAWCLMTGMIALQEGDVMLQLGVSASILASPHNCSKLRRLSLRLWYITQGCNVFICNTCVCLQRHGSPGVKPCAYVGCQERVPSHAPAEVGARPAACLLRPRECRCSSCGENAAVGSCSNVSTDNRLLYCCCMASGCKFVAT